MNQPDLFGKIDTLPTPRRLLMCVFDAGDNDGGAPGDNSKVIARFRCSRCGVLTDRVTVASVAEAKQGIPCEKCNNKNAVHG